MKSSKSDFIFNYKGKSTKVSAKETSLNKWKIEINCPWCKRGKTSAVANSEPTAEKAFKKAKESMINHYHNTHE